MDIAEAEGLSAVILFIDIVTAFASLLRAIVIDAPECAEALAKYFTARGLHRYIICIVVDRIVLGRARIEQELGPHLAKLLADVHRCTWVTIEGTANVVKTTAGSLAGNALGDLLFYCSMSCVNCTVRERLGAAGLVPPFSTSRINNLLEICWLTNSSW
jgi:hypothetical protein